MQVDHDFCQFSLDVTVVHPFYGGSAIYVHQTKGRKTLTEDNNKYVFQLKLAYIFSEMKPKKTKKAMVGPTLTLCSDRVRDWTGITEAISVDCSDHEEIDSSRLQVSQDEGLRLNMLCHGHPSAS